MNLLPCTKTDGEIDIQRQAGAAATFRAIIAANWFVGAPNATELVLAVHPEDVHLLDAATPESLQAKLVVIEMLGSENIINVEVAGHVIKAGMGPRFRSHVDHVSNVRIDQCRSHLFNAETTDCYITSVG